MNRAYSAARLRGSGFSSKHFQAPKKYFVSQQSGAQKAGKTIFLPTDYWRIDATNC
jgi:hypothetical protein